MESDYIKIQSVFQFYEVLSEHERLMVDVLRQIVKENSASHIREKTSYNVPFFMDEKIFVSFGHPPLRTEESRKGFC